MTEKLGTYHREDGTPFNKPKSPAQTNAEAFVEGIQAFHWGTDFVRFCEVFGLEADDYADRKYQAFQELVERLNQLDVEMLAKMIESGNPPSQAINPLFLWLMMQKKYGLSCKKNGGRK